MPGGIITLSPAFLQLLDNLLPADATDIPLHKLHLLPSSSHADVPLLLTPDDFASQNVQLPRAFARNPAKLLEVARWNGNMLLVKMNKTLQEGSCPTLFIWRYSWRERLEPAISIATIRQVFPGMPPEVDDTSKSVQDRVYAAIDWLLERARYHVSDAIASLCATMESSTSH